MTKYVCVGCGFESNDDNMSGKPCPYCGEYSCSGLLRDMEKS